MILRDSQHFAQTGSIAPGTAKEFRFPSSSRLAGTEADGIVPTTEANELLAPYHDRMPVILRPEDYELWLNGGAGQPELTPLLRPYPHEKMAAYAVSRLVNAPSNDSPKCVEPLAVNGN